MKIDFINMGKKRKKKKTYKKHILEATRFRSPSRFTKKRGRNHPTQKKRERERENKAKNTSIC